MFVVLLHYFLPLIFYPSALHNVCHPVDYTTHEVPLFLFGLGHDWTCTLPFRGAPLLTVGKHELQSSLL